MRDRFVYLAGPFFNDEQRVTMARLEETFQRYGRTAFSPRKECFCPPDATEEQRKFSFQANCQHIYTADLVLAVIDDRDVGTMWEMGYAYARGVSTMAFTSFPDRGINLMLAQSVSGFLKGFENLEEFLEMSRSRGFWCWEAGQRWKGQII